MKKLISIIIMCAMLLSVSACSNKEAEPLNKTDGTAAITSSACTVAGKSDYIEGEGAICDEVGMGASDMAFAGTEWNGSGIQAQAGTLTAGVWNDNDHWSFWNDLYQIKSEWETHRTTWAKPNLKRYFVTVSNGDTPLENVSVKLVDNQYKTLWEAKTDNSGKCYLFADAATNSAVKITTDVPDVNGNITADTTHELALDTTKDAYEFKLTSGKNETKSLDLMLMVDTTGSMGDELDYLKTELESIINRVVSTNGNIPVRVSVNFYRDDGDEYVVRPFEFTSDIARAVSDLKAQSYDGGGDFPEAVDQALSSALTNHQWNENSTKLMLLVLDAPSHETPEINAKMNEMTSLAAQKGVRIIPVASSGIDKATEYLLRDLAFKTGGQYIFLTSDSGVGGAHITPTIGDFTVEKLNDLLVKLIGTYLEDAKLAQYVDEKVEVKVVPEGEVTGYFTSTDCVQGDYILNLEFNNTTNATYSGSYLPTSIEKSDIAALDSSELSKKQGSEQIGQFEILPNTTTNYSINLSKYYDGVETGLYCFKANYTDSESGDVREVCVYFEIGEADEGTLEALSPEIVTEGEDTVLKFVISNSTRMSYSYGEQPYTLKHFDSSANSWVEVPVKDDIMWIEIAHIIEAGKSNNYSINLTKSYTALEKGKYSYCIDFYGDVEKTVLEVEFDIF